VRLIEALKKEVLLGDGANGTCLSERGFTRQPYDLANILAPDLVRAVHQDYFDAGSDFVETNTFKANRIAMADFDVDIRELNLAGARLAREVAGDRFVFGAIGPAGKPMEPIGHFTRDEIAESVREQALALAEGGVDALILETFIDNEELKVAVQAARSVTDIPIIVSKAFIEDGEMIASGLPIRFAKEMEDLGVVAIGANCIVGPQRMLDLVRMMSEECGLPILAQPTPGLPQLVKGHITYDTSPDYFAKAVARLVEEGARIVGGCCGTTPEHIRQLRQALDSQKVKAKRRSRHQAVDLEKAPLPESEPSELAQKLGRKFIVTVEMDLPRGLSVDKVLAGAKSLKVRGADLIDISDGARARLRMNPMSICSIIQNRVGIETMMHFSCRDRNLLAVQADLLGCHAMGIRNILAITGDPATIGDYPSATSVFDVEAIGLVRILSRFNEGIDLAGNSVGMKCAFTIAVAFNPLAGDSAQEIDRLRQKVDAGAHVVYTQPIFDFETAERTVEITRGMGVPCFIGSLPLRSHRHCEFMHNEVPGITVPDWLRQRMAEAPDDTSALEVGIEEAQSLASRIKEIADGLYLMPPFGSHQIAERVMEAVQ
jgi:methionine synthase I (cobalamin-dependent)/5,10-methylenetetrahydrofolate reductase